jgi:hypothetical protein
MARRKHQFHCAKCHSACTIYKKGRSHRVLVCPHCGVLATNPFSAMGGLEGAATGAALGSIVPGVGTAIGAGVGGLIGAFSGGGGKPKPSTGSVSPPSPAAHGHLSAFEKAVMLEALEARPHGHSW